MLSNIKAFKEYVKTDDSPLTGSDGNWTVKEGVNASLYCYASPKASGGVPANVKFTETHEVNYEEVFVNGNVNENLTKLTAEEMAQVVFYYKPLCEVPLLEIIDNVEQVLNRLEITDLLAIASSEGEMNPIISNIFDGQTIGGVLYNKDFKIEDLLVNLKLSDVEGIKDTLGAFGELKVFNGWQEVEQEELPETDINGVLVKGEQNEKIYNRLLYWYKSLEDGETVEYSCAFDENDKLRNL